MNVGFIGLGIMGRPMALHLHAAGHALFVPDRASLTPELRAAATVLGDASAVAEHADMVITMLPDTPDVDRVLFGPHGVAEGLSRGKLVIDMSSISPLATVGFAARVTGLGCEWLDAPVSGGEIGAKAATLTIMAGGKAAAFARALPLLQAMGKAITHVGDAAGAGQTCKVANQMIVALNIQAVAEALVFAQRAGADPARVREALLGGFAGSRVLEVHGERMIKRSFAPGFRLRLHRKDLNLAMATAWELDLALPATALASQMFAAAAARGDGEADHSALILAVEALGGASLPGVKS